MADAQLVQRMAIGDRDAHDELCERHRLSLYAQVYVALLDAAAAERVVAETFDQAWCSAKQYDAGAGSPLTWLSRIARGLAERRLAADL